MPGLQVTDAQIENALIRNFGNVTMAAAELGVTPRCLRYRVDAEAREKFAAIRGELNEQILDLSEAGAVQHMLNGSESMIRFILGRRGQARGWGSTTALTGADGGPIQLAATPVVQGDEMPEDEKELLRELLQRQRARLQGG